MANWIRRRTVTFSEGGVRHVEHGAVRCACGAEVVLYYDAIQCEQCGQHYNLFGQRLRPPEEWGSEYP